MTTKYFSYEEILAYNIVDNMKICNFALIILLSLMKKEISCMG